MRSGSLRHVMELQTKPPADVAEYDEHGQEVEVWTTAATIRARITPLSGRELLNAMAIRHDVSHEIATRYRGVLNPALTRLVMGNRIFNIASIRTLDERNHETRIMATETVSNVH